MIIRNDRSRTILWKRAALLGALALTLPLALYLSYRAYKNRWREAAMIVCDMETMVEVDGVKYFMAGDLRLNNGQTQVRGHARSGQYSCRVHAKDQFGVTYESDTLQPGEAYEVTVWRQQPDRLGMLVCDATWGEYKQGIFSGREEPGGWEQLIVRIKVPPYAVQPRVKFYLWNDQEDTAYFDDFVVRKIESGYTGHVGGYVATDSVPVLDLRIGDAGFEKLARIRQEALEKGILAAREDAWATGSVVDGKDEFPGRVRLKGDWTDHLVGDKWSFRIALDEGHAWRNMKTFSVQNPLTRDFLSEWTYHELLHEEQVITPRYGFLELRINGVSKGLYAYEEHFEQQIVEYNSHREGPILKWDEEGLWELQERALVAELPETEKHVPVYQASDIVPFGAKAVLKDSKRLEEFKIAQQLVQQYKAGEKNVWDIFDAAKVARYYAIIDLLNAQHGLIWHNQRWYYNPVISRLEPIGFDGFTESGPLVWIDRPIIGFARNVRYMAAGYRELMFERFFHNRAFVELYVAALMRYTSPQFLEEFYFRIGPRLRQYERWVQHEWPDYIYNVKGIFDRARSIRLLLIPLERSSVKAHLQGKTDQGYHYRVYNYHCLPLALQGVGSKRGELDESFAEDKLLDAYNAEFPAEYTDIFCKKEGKYIFFQVPGMDSLFQADILPWPQPEGDTPEQELFQGLKMASNELYSVDSASKRVTFKAGSYKTSRDVLIPAGYKVWFEQGVTLDLTGGAKFISKSEVIMLGSEEAPIHITSSDESAQGFTILQAPFKSELRYVIFDHLGALDYKGWHLTGAVTFYESEVLIDRSRFVSNHSEDALNPIRSVFTMNNSYIGYTSADGLDADFCHVSITNATISHTDKDAMEFTGGQVTVVSAQIDHAGGHGVGFGDQCAGTIIDATMRNCEVGLATEDLSTANVIDIALYDNQQGIVVRQKRPEYGPASVVVKRHKEATNGQLYLVEPGSKLSLSGQEIEGKQ